MTMNIATRQYLNEMNFYKMPKVADCLSSANAKAVYSFIYTTAINPITRVYKDYDGEYINLARTVIAEATNLSVKTVIKYMKELTEKGLIKDVRMGVNKLNKIYLCKVGEVFTYKKKKQSKESDVVLKARDILGSFSMSLSTKQINDLLGLCKMDFDLLKKSVDYVNGQSDVKDALKYLKATIKNRYFENVKQQPVQKQTQYYAPKRMNSFTAPSVTTNGREEFRDNDFLLSLADFDMFER